MIAGLSNSLPANAATDGVIIGGVAGATAGAVIGSQSNQTAEGAVIGAILGGLAGAVLSEAGNNQVDASEQRYHRRACRDGSGYFDRAHSSRHIDQKIQLMREGLRYCPDNAAAYNDLGVALVLSGDYASARIQFNHAIRLDSGYQPAYRNLDHLDRRYSKREYNNERRDHGSKAKRSRDSGSHEKRDERRHRDKHDD